MKRSLRSGFLWVAALALLGMAQADPAVKPSPLQEKLTGHCKAMADAYDGPALEKTFGTLLKALEVPEVTAEQRDASKAEALTVLLASKEKRLKDLASKVNNSSGFNQIRALKVELNKRREAALKGIYDTKIYFRESDPEWMKGDKINGQARVDELVLKKSPGSVEELWQSAGMVTASLDSSIRRDIEIIQVINVKCMKPLGGTPGDGDLKPYEEMLLNMNGRIDVRGFAFTAKEAETYAWNRHVDKYNEALSDPSVTKMEKEHARVVNDYREMMGRRRLFLDARLCRATSKHSAACASAGQIWHEGSDGTPDSRAKAEGFPDGVSENVAMGFAPPKEIWWRGWYRASDHHRNALLEGHACMGFGYSGNIGTENFATIPPPKGLLEK